MKNNIFQFLPWQRNSLKVRLVFSAMLMIIIILPIIGVTLNNAFKVQIRNSIKNELSAYSYSILAVAEVEQKKLFMPDQLLDNQLNVSQTGLYALITTTTKSKQELSKVLWRSKSFLGLDSPTNLPTPKLGEFLFNDIEIAGRPHLIYSFSVSFGTKQQAFPVTLHIIKDQTDFLNITAEFNQQLWTWLLVLMVLLMVVQIVWLTWTLKPLTTLKKELANIEQGKAARLEQQYPQELTQVTQQVNALLNTEQSQRQRYRNALSDLAHSLKTPLAVMQSQNDLSASAQEQLMIINRTIEHQLKRAQSAGQSSWHLGIKVKSSADKLVKTLAKIYQTKQLTIDTDIDKQALFKGDEADLLEIMGNILDNAYKAANDQIALNVAMRKHTLLISVADDGAGINETQKQRILERGIRADTYQQGHGIGLAIVRDLVTSYRGELSIETSPLLGGALFVIKLPSF